MQSWFVSFTGHGELLAASLPLSARSCPRPGSSKAPGQLVQELTQSLEVEDGARNAKVSCPPPGVTKSMAKVKRRGRPLDRGCLFRNTCPALHRQKENKIQRQIKQMQKERRAGERPG